MIPDDLQEFDEVIVSGTSSSPVQEWKDLQCIVATISKDKAYIKFWPKDDNIVPKIWFPVDQITQLTIVSKFEK